MGLSIVIIKVKHRINLRRASSVQNMSLFLSCFAPDMECTVLSEQTWTLPHLGELVEKKN